MGQTAAERNRRTARGESVADATPTVEALQQSIQDFRCAWCGRDSNRDGTPLKSLSAHWAKSHGISVQWVRDYLCLPKTASFVTQEVSAACAERSKARYDPDKLRCKGGARELSRFGIEAQRRKLAGISPESREAGAQKAREAKRSTETHPHMLRLPMSVHTHSRAIERGWWAKNLRPCVRHREAQTSRSGARLWRDRPPS